MCGGTESTEKRSEGVLLEVIFQFEQWIFGITMEFYIFTTGNF